MNEAVLKKAGVIAGKIAFFAFEFVCGIIGFIW